MKRLFETNPVAHTPDLEKPAVILRILEKLIWVAFTVILILGTKDLWLQNTTLG